MLTIDSGQVGIQAPDQSCLDDGPIFRVGVHVFDVLPFELDEAAGSQLGEHLSPRAHDDLHGGTVDEILVAERPFAPLFLRLLPALWDRMRKIDIFISIS